MKTPKLTSGSLPGRGDLPGDLTLADLPALLLAFVSAITVTTGARLLRGQDQPLMLALGVGVAGATVILDKLLIERLNSVRPRQSLLALVICWLPMFLFATALATLATFSWIAPEVSRRDLEQSRRLHWTREAEKLSRHTVGLKLAVRHRISQAQTDIDLERRRAAAARVEGTTYSPEALRAATRGLATMRELEKRVGAYRPLSLEAPSGGAGPDTLDRAFQELGDVHASVAVSVPDAPRLPAYENYSPPAADLQSVLADETRRGSSQALIAWSAALWVEILPLLALWRGGRKVPLASRILQWRSRLVEVGDAARGRRPPSPLPIVIEPLQVRGVVRVALASEYTLRDCTPLLEEAIGALVGVLGSYQLAGIANARGDALNEHLPLLPQLYGEPLVLSVVEGPQ
jgi:hypothetical protein